MAEVLTFTYPEYFSKNKFFNVREQYNFKLAGKFIWQHSRCRKENELGKQKNKCE